MKTKRSTVLVLAFLSGLSFLNAQSNSVKQTTPEYIYPVFRNVLKMVEENSLDYKKLDMGLLDARYSRDIGLSNRYPSVGLSTGLGGYWSNYENSSGETQGAQIGINDLSLSTSYSLYSWGSVTAGRRMTEKAYQGHLIDYELRMASITRSLRIQFFNLILQKFALRTLELELSINQTNINEDTVRHEQGRLSAENYERSINSRKSRLLDLEQQRKNINRAIEDFNLTIGIENAITLEDLPTEVPSVGNVIDELMAMANQSRSKQFSDFPRVKRSLIDLDIAEYNIIQDKSRTKPNLGLSGSVRMDIEPTEGNQQVVSVRAGLGVSWNIYSGGANSRRVLRSLNNRTRQMAEYLDQLEHISIDLNRIIEDLEYNYNKLDISESNYQLELQSYEKSKDEYERGRISELQFLHVELNRLYQERNIYNVRRNYIISITDLLALLGKDPVLDILTRPGEKDLSHLTENY